MALPVGTQLGRYTVLKPLASSGMTEVLLARAQGMGGFQHHVVIKAIRANKSTDPSFISAFVDEARLAASLHHHHIVQVHDVGREGDDYFFAMEYVHGANLRALLAKVAHLKALVPLDQVITIAMGVAAGLHYAHEQNLVHRDVTPANILVGYDGNVKVADFGIAKALFESSVATKSGSMRGKVAYMAPEQCLGRPIDRRSDIFSLGVVLYELATARRLFKDDNDFLVMTSIVNGKIPKPTEFRPDMPLELEDVILKALASKPALRFATAEELAMALERVAVTNAIRTSPNALAEYLKELFGKREEPWLDDSAIEHVDVDFDGGGSGLVTLPPEVKRMRQGSVPPGELGDEIDTMHDDDDEAATVVSDAAQLASGFEGEERTLIGDQADVDMLVKLSKIEARKDVFSPGTDPPAPKTPHDTSPMPAIKRTPTESESATVVENDAIPTPLMLPPPVVVPPEHHPASGILQRLQSSPQPDTGVTGTPMGWQSDGEVISLAPRGRRVVLIAAIVIPIIAIVLLAIVLRDDDEVRSAKTEPDAYVAPDAAIDAPIDEPVPDAGTR